MAHQELNTLDPRNLQTLSRPALQQLAKAHRLKAIGTNDALRERLLQYTKKPLASQDTVEPATGEASTSKPRPLRRRVAHLSINSASSRVDRISRASSGDTEIDRDTTNAKEPSGSTAPSLRRAGTVGFPAQQDTSSRPQPNALMRTGTLATMIDNRSTEGLPGEGLHFLRRNEISTDVDSEGPEPRPRQRNYTLRFQPSSKKRKADEFEEEDRNEAGSATLTRGVRIGAAPSPELVPPYLKEPLARLEKAIQVGTDLEAFRETTRRSIERIEAALRQAGVNAESALDVQKQKIATLETLWQEEKVARAEFEAKLERVLEAERAKVTTLQAKVEQLELRLSGASVTPRQRDILQPFAGSQPLFSFRGDIRDSPDIQVTLQQNLETREEGGKKFIHGPPRKKQRIEGEVQEGSSGLHEHSSRQSGLVAPWLSSGPQEGSDERRPHKRKRSQSEEPPWVNSPPEVARAFEIHSEPRGVLPRSSRTPALVNLLAPDTLQQHGRGSLRGEEREQARSFDTGSQLQGTWQGKR